MVVQILCPNHFYILRTSVYTQITTEALLPSSFRSFSPAISPALRANLNIPESTQRALLPLAERYTEGLALD